MIIRQGDLLFVPCETIPESSDEIKDGIIARGEVTGHTHRLRTPGVQASLMVAAGLAYVRAMMETPIDHEEHATVMLPPGNWKVVRQVEYTPEGLRQVAD
jgi:hypothetical protein